MSAAKSPLAAMKHVKAAVQHGKLKGLPQGELSEALITQGLKLSQQLDDLDATLLTRSVYAYATSLILQRKRARHIAEGGDATEFDAEVAERFRTMFETLALPPFLARSAEVSK